MWRRTGNGNPPTDVLFACVAPKNARGERGLRIAEQVTFGGGKVERAARLRSSAAEVRELFLAPGARMLLLWNSKPLFDESGGISWLETGHPFLAHAAEQPFFLGLFRGQPRFAVDVSGWKPGAGDGPFPDEIRDQSEERHESLPEGTRFANLRRHMSGLRSDDAEFVAMGKAIANWHRTHPRCARCGEATEAAAAGWQRKCPACGADHFCRTDPVVIMLITSGNRLLLGRSPGWPEGMRSLLAGFVEPGETIEAAVRREVQEESGVVVGAVSYLASQPWPFPTSLMIGCRGEALTDDLKVDTNELESAEWVSQEDMMDVYARPESEGGRPREGAIADFLIRNWLADRLD